MSAECIMKEIREALEGRPGQPIVLGVCNSIAKRLGWETWCVRLAAIIATLIFTIPIVVAYIIAGYMMSDTEDRTRGFFSGLGVIAREWIARLSDGFGRAFNSGRSGYRGY